MELHMLSLRRGVLHWSDRMNEFFQFNEDGSDGHSKDGNTGVGLIPFCCCPRSVANSTFETIAVNCKYDKCLAKRENNKKKQSMSLRSVQMQCNAMRMSNKIPISDSIQLLPLLSNQNHEFL